MSELNLTYTSEEIKELKKLIQLSTGFGTLHAIGLITMSKYNSELGFEDFERLASKCEYMSDYQELEFITDIHDLLMGNAKLSNIQMYVVYDRYLDEYLVSDNDGELEWGNEQNKAIKSKEVWLLMNPAYELMLEKVTD